MDEQPEDIDATPRRAGAVKYDRLLQQDRLVTKMTFLGAALVVYATIALRFRRR